MTQAECEKQIAQEILLVVAGLDLRNIERARSAAVEAANRISALSALERAGPTEKRLGAIIKDFTICHHDDPTTHKCLRETCLCEAAATGIATLLRNHGIAIAPSIVADQSETKHLRDAPTAELDEVFRDATLETSLKSAKHEG
jgi:hypothetical protein